LTFFPRAGYICRLRECGMLCRANPKARFSFSAPSAIPCHWHKKT
jgi:hypothetical protein